MSETPADVTRLREKRKKLAHRRRRIVFNNDGDDMQNPQAVTAAGLLEGRTTVLLGSQVDAIWYHSSHGLKLNQKESCFARLYGHPDPGGLTTGNLQKLMAREGKDALEVMIDTCHERGIEIFWSNRMNDIHDSFRPEILTNIKREHPEYMLSTVEEGKKYGWKSWPDPRTRWSALDFERPEIRDLTVSAMHDICKTYDIDGIELDFLRQELYFRPTLERSAVEEEHLAVMNDMMRKLRAVTEEEGSRRGRPILLAARSAETLQFSKDVGLDVETWLKENLIDVLVVGRTELGFMVPGRELFDLAHDHEVPVYADLLRGHSEDSSGRDPKVWRGVAMYRFWEGADGVYIFNLFDPIVPMWWELGETDKLAKTDKAYVWDWSSAASLIWQAGPPEGNLAEVLPKQRMHDLRPRPPMTVSEAGCEVVLMVGEDLSAAPPSGKHRLLTLRVHMMGLSAEHRPAIKINGQPVGNIRVAHDFPGTITFESAASGILKKPADVWLVCRPDTALFHPGENRVAVSARRFLSLPLGESDLPTVDQIRLDVDCV